jgi:hypothetical protein
VRLAWFFGGICFAGIAVLCWYAQLHEFAIGSAIVGLGMFTEAGIKEDK